MSQVGLLGTTWSHDTLPSPSPANAHTHTHSHIRDDQSLDFYRIIAGGQVKKEPELLDGGLLGNPKG